MSEIKIHIEIGENLASVIKQNPKQIELIMKNIKELYLGQQIYACQLCGAHHYIGQACNYVHSKKKE